MRVRVHFYSYFKDLTGCAETEEDLAVGSSISDLLARIHGRFPKLAGMGKSTLIAVGVEYQRPEYILQDGEEVSLFPPVQGG